MGWSEGLSPAVSGLGWPFVKASGGGAGAWGQSLGGTVAVAAAARRLCVCLGLWWLGRGLMRYRGKGSPPREPGWGKEADFAGAFDAADAAHLGALAVRAAK